MNILRDLNPFAPRFPRSDKYVESKWDEGGVKRILDSWRSQPGQLIQIQDFTDLDQLNLDKISLPTVVHHLETAEKPKKSIEDLKEIKILSLNMNALGVRDDEIRHNTQIPWLTLPNIPCSI